MSLLNKKNTRRFILEAAGELRPAAGFTRVSEDFLIAAEERLKATIRGMVKAHPTKGTTLK